MKANIFISNEESYHQQCYNVLAYTMTLLLKIMRFLECESLNMNDTYFETRVILVTKITPNFHDVFY